jgi:hypothetical protein
MQASHSRDTAQKGGENSRTCGAHSAGVFAPPNGSAKLGSNLHLRFSQLEGKVTEQVRQDRAHLHLREVLADAVARRVREG